MSGVIYSDYNIIFGNLEEIKFYHKQFEDMDVFTDEDFIIETISHNDNHIKNGVVQRRFGTVEEALKERDARRELEEREWQKENCI